MESDAGWGRPRVRGGLGISRCARMAALALCLGVLSVGVVASACATAQELLSSGTSGVAPTTTASGEPASTIATDPASSSTAATGAPSTTATAAASGPQITITQIFAQIAQAAAPRPTYGLTELPSGAAIAPQWWPVLFMAAPTDYEGPVVSNPRITGEGPGNQEVQLVLTMGDGWLVILENFRGDLGDVVGSPAGKVAGHLATLHTLNDGILVQWSDQGAWYGVFGRGLPSTEVVRIALRMTLVGPGH